MARMPSQISKRAVLQPSRILPIPSVVWAVVPRSFGKAAGIWLRSPWSIGSKTSAAIPFRAKRAPIV